MVTGVIQCETELPIPGQTVHCGRCNLQCSRVMVLQCQRKGPPSQGLGDTIAKLAEATGVAKVVAKIEAVTGVDCGCHGRREALNRLVQYAPAVALDQQSQPPTE